MGEILIILLKDLLERTLSTKILILKNELFFKYPTGFMRVKFVI